MLGGYKTVTPIQLASVVHARDSGDVDGTGVRVFWACLAAVAAREAAGRVRRRRVGEARRGDVWRLEVEELARLTGLSVRAARRGLRQLVAAGLVTIGRDRFLISAKPRSGSEDLLDAIACGRSPRRPIPMPRAMLRSLARDPRPANWRVVAAYAIRGLSLERGTGRVRHRGTVKAPWIADTFSMSLRAVRYAQAELRRIGWISKDTGSKQWKLNRDGAYFEIDQDWRPVAHENEGCDAAGKGVPIGAVAASPEPFVNRDKPGPNPAPPPAENGAPFAPPREDSETSYESKDQETRLPGGDASGDCTEGEGEENPEHRSEFEADLRNVVEADLRNLGRLEALYGQAVQRGWIEACDANALNFVAAAVRAREAKGSAVRIFVALVRQRLWSHITQAQEDRARMALARIRETDPLRFRVVGTSSANCAGKAPPRLSVPGSAPGSGTGSLRWSYRRPDLLGMESTSSADSPIPPSPGLPPVACAGCA